MELSEELASASHTIISVVNGNTDGGVKGIEAKIDTNNAKIDTNNAAVSTKLSALELRMQGIVDLMQQQQQQRAAAEATAQAQTASTVAEMKTMLENVIKNERTRSRNKLTILLERASASASSSSSTMIFAELRTLEDRQIQREYERDEKASQRSAALMGELSSLKEAVKKNAAKLSALEQKLKSVQTSVNGVEKMCKETKTKLAAIRAIVGKNELTCNQTKDSMASFETKLSSFIKAQADVSRISEEDEESDDEDDDDDDIEGDDGTEDGEESIVDNATSLKRKRESQWMAQYDRLRDYCKNRDEFPTIEQLNNAYPGFKLGTWVNNQRNHYRNQRGLVKNRVELLDKVTGWKWITRKTNKRANEDGEEDSIDKTNDNRSERKRAYEEDNNNKWMAHYDRLRKYCKNLDEFPTRSILDNAYSDFKLGDWVNNQRRYRNTMSDERVKLLEKVSGWKWIIGAGRKRSKN